jgi:hypothetical protein
MLHKMLMLEIEGHFHGLSYYLISKAPLEEGLVAMRQIFEEEITYCYMLDGYYKVPIRDLLTNHIDYSSPSGPMCMQTLLYWH